MCHIASGRWLAEREQLDRAAPMSWWRRRVFKTCRVTQMPHKKNPNVPGSSRGTNADLPYDGSFCQPRFVTLIICKCQEKTRNGREILS